LRQSLSASPTRGAIVATLPLGSVGYEPEPNAKGERHVWLEPAIVDRLGAMRCPGESYSDVIMRLVEIEAGRRICWPQIDRRRLLLANAFAADLVQTGLPRLTPLAFARRDPGRVAVVAPLVCGAR
jgi:hypothetical protein